MLIENIRLWELLAGLGLFLFGMYMLEESLKMIAGRSFKKFLRKHTTNPIKAVLSGTLVTAILQSSSMVTLLVMSFTGTGIIGLKNGIGMILGANLGTTITGWMVSLIGFKLDIESFIFPFMAVGGLGLVFLKAEKSINIAKLLMGFSIMFLGLDYMKKGGAEFAQNVDLSFLQHQNLFVFMLVGFLLAAAIQSSSASMMIFLTSLASGIISLDQAAFLIIGADLGTTSTGLLGTINANETKKKTGWSQFYINVFSSVIAIFSMNILFSIIHRFLHISDPLIALVAFHSMFNLTGILLLLPFLGFFTKMIDRFISPNDTSVAKIIAQSNPKEIQSAIDALMHEAKLFLLKSISLNSFFFRVTINNHIAEKPISYLDLKKYENEITRFYIQLQQNQQNESEVTAINNITATIRNAALSVKDIKDVKHNFEEVRNSGNDLLYQFYKRVKKYQADFYEEVSMLVNHVIVVSSQEEEIERLKTMNTQFNNIESESILNIYNEINTEEVNMSSLFNMIRDINNSNESLLRSVHHYLAYTAGDNFLKKG